MHDGKATVECNVATPGPAAVVAGELKIIGKDLGSCSGTIRIVPLACYSKTGPCGMRVSRAL